jgi:GNAT superfamily N-acetyltransferase
VVRIEIAGLDAAAEVASLVRDISRTTYERCGPEVRRWAQDMAVEEIWTRRIAQPHSTVLTASDAAVVVGVVWVAAVGPRGAHGTDGYLGGLYVALPGRGTGASLVRHAERHAASWRCRALLAEALCDGAGHRMLSHVGWRERGRHSGRIVTGGMWVELVRELDAAAPGATQG